MREKKISVHYWPGNLPKLNQIGNLTLLDYCNSTKMDRTRNETYDIQVQCYDVE